MPGFTALLQPLARFPIIFTFPPQVESLPIKLPGLHLTCPQHPCPLTLSGSHSQHDPASSFILYQEEQQLVVQGPLFAPAIIQDRGQSQSHIGMSTSHAAVGGQGTSFKGPTLCTVPVQWMPISLPAGQLSPTPYSGKSRQVARVQQALLCPYSQNVRHEASPVSLTWCLAAWALIT